MEAVAALGEGGACASRLWRSPAWPPGGLPYVNAAMAIRTRLPPDDLLAALHGVEAAFGRERRARWAARTLDLDLLALGGLVRPDAATQARWRALDPGRQGREAPDGLVLPHPRMQDRAFVLLPLREVAPDWRHPLLGLDAGGMILGLSPEAADGVAPLDGSPGGPPGGPPGGAPLAKAPPTH
jgi:2-amino-4-hydroxy-6-hydroxymethyldihydropteridine diphosphokinase